MTDRLTALSDYLSQFHTAGVAFSGGVDSAVLAAAAVRALGSENVLAITAVSPSFSRCEREALERTVAGMNLNHTFLPTSELDDPDYRRNDRLRCYYCKRLLFRQMREFAETRGLDTLLEGSNADDQLVYRPGRRALEELCIPSPLATFGFTKAEIRQLAADWGLSVAQKPSVPCLASRVMYGIPLSSALFQKIEHAEEIFCALFKPSDNFRLRVHPDDLLRVEVSSGDFQKVVSNAEVMESFREEMHTLGFRFVTLDLDGFRVGSLDR